LPILRRHYTNAGLVTVVCGCRCGLVSGCGKTAVFPHPEILTHYGIPYGFTTVVEIKIDKSEKTANISFVLDIDRLHNSWMA
jgi:hypothetical protein